jgi:hypothetical protein
VEKEGSEGGAGGGGSREGGRGEEEGKGEGSRKELAELITIVGGADSAIKGREETVLEALCT